VVSWRTPNTYLTAGAGRGPPPQLLRDPGQPLNPPTHPATPQAAAGAHCGSVKAPTHVCSA
jgi:hypothetical protein